MSRFRDIARSAVPYGLPSVLLHRELAGLGRGPGGDILPKVLDVVHRVTEDVDRRDVATVGRAFQPQSSFAWLDLRTGPVLLSSHAHQHDHPTSAVIVDLYSRVVGRVPTPTAAPGDATYLVRGPSSSSPGLVVAGTLDCPTDLCLMVLRNAAVGDDDRFDVADLDPVVTLQPLGPPAEPLAPPDPVDLREPLGWSFLRALDWMLALMPRLPGDYEVRAELAELGCGTGLVDVLIVDEQSESDVLDGLRMGLADVERRAAVPGAATDLAHGHDPHDHLARAAAALLGIVPDDT